MSESEDLDAGEEADGGDSVELDALGLRAYARHRQQLGLPGGTMRAVQVAIATGRLSKSLTPDGKRIADALAADAEWERTTNANRVPLTGRTSPPTSREDREARRLLPSKEGYVYVVRCEVPACSNCGHQPERPIKIGKAGDVDFRLKGLQIGNPYQLSVVHTFFAEEPTRLESTLHRRLRDAHLRGEWFKERDASLAILGIDDSIGDV
jgi:hypothetical protein